MISFLFFTYNEIKNIFVILTTFTPKQLYMFYKIYDHFNPYPSKLKDRNLHRLGMSEFHDNHQDC